MRVASARSASRSHQSEGGLEHGIHDECPEHCGADLDVDLLKSFDEALEQVEQRAPEEETDRTPSQASYDADSAVTLPHQEEGDHDENRSEVGADRALDLDQRGREIHISRQVPYIWDVLHGPAKPCPQMMIPVLHLDIPGQQGLSRSTDP